MMRQDIEQGRGVVFVDAKGSTKMPRSFTIWCVARTVSGDFILSLIILISRHTYNPSTWKSDQLKDKITASIDWSEPFYQGVCEHVLQALFMDLEAAGKRVTLKEVEQCLKEPSPH